MPPPPPNLLIIRVRAFTLAEVLITLGIIGIIAALTMPALIANYQKQQTLTRLKTAYNILNNAMERAKADYGTDINSWEIPDTAQGASALDASTYFAEHYLIPYLKVVKKCDRKNAGTKCYSTIYQLNGAVNQKYDNQNDFSFILANGSAIIIEIFPQNNRQRIFGYIDINGTAKPNTIGKDIFVAEMGYYGTRDYKYSFYPYAYSYSNTRNRYTSHDETSCNKQSNGLMCFALIMHDGWEIKDDYPW